MESKVMDNNFIHIARKRFDSLSYKYTNLRSSIEYLVENINDLRRRKNINQVVESAIGKFKASGGIFSKFALTESSVRCFCNNLLTVNLDSYKIIEFGAGQSTDFFSYLSDDVNLQLTSYEHNRNYYEALIKKINNRNISLFHRELRSVDDMRRENIFSEPDNALSVWKNETLPVPEELYENTRLHNCFYEMREEDVEGRYVDAVVVDGPHGNGRSLCFPLFAKVIRTGTLILIDDFHHYKFLDDLSRIFSYREIEKRKYKYSNKGWVLLRIV